MYASLSGLHLVIHQTMQSSYLSLPRYIHVYWLDRYMCLFLLLDISTSHQKKKRRKRHKHIIHHNNYYTYTHTIHLHPFHWREYSRLANGVSHLVSSRFISRSPILIGFSDPVTMYGRYMVCIPGSIDILRFHFIQQYNYR